MDQRPSHPLANEGRYRLLIEAITDYAISMLDPAGVILSWNTGASQLTGYSAEEIVGQSFSRLYTQDDLNAGLPQLALRKADSEGRFEADGWRMRKDGSRFRVHEVIDPIRGPSGEIVGFAQVLRDLLRQRGAQAALRQSEEQFRRLVQGVTDYAIFMLDPGGRVSSWNPGAQRIKGYAPDEIIGEHFSRFYTEEDRADDMPGRGLATARREGRWETEGWRVRKDGSRFWAHVVIDPIRDESGEIVGFAKITRDITERREAQQALEEAREALFQSQKMEAVGQLTGGVAHDFNNLLTVILGGLDTIRRSKPGETQKVSRAVEMSLHAAQRAASLTSRLLAFSRRQPLEPTPTDLNILVRNMTELLHRTLGEDIELEGVLMPRLWKAEVDQNQLESAILNLAVNARDAMPGGGKLTIETANAYLDEHYAAADSEVIPGDYVVVAVSDTGVGMDSQTLSRAFEPFFTTKELGRGTGLGLSMVYGFVKQSGGHVTIYSEPGEGTTVRLYFPKFLAAEAGGGEAEQQPAPPGGGDECVLVLEDNDDVRGFSVMTLKELGYKVLEASSGEAAMAILRQADQHIDLLFTDIVLPGVSGRSVADEARNLRPDLKVLFTTGYSRNAIVHQGRLDPGVQLISKPFTYDQLADKVRQVLNPAVRSPLDA